MNADEHARLNARKTYEGCKHEFACKCDPPHYLRCEYIDSWLRRCNKGAGHLDEHRFAKT